MAKHKPEPEKVEPQPETFPEPPLGLVPATIEQPVAEQHAGDRDEEPQLDAAGRRSVTFWRECPICHRGELNGVGTCYSTKAGGKRHYKCDRCGHTWTWTPQQLAAEIKHREPRLDVRSRAELDAR